MMFHTVHMQEGTSGDVPRCCHVTFFVLFIRKVVTVCLNQNTDPMWLGSKTLKNNNEKAEKGCVSCRCHKKHLRLHLQVQVI